MDWSEIYRTYYAGWDETGAKEDYKAKGNDLATLQRERGVPATGDIGSSADQQLIQEIVGIINEYESKLSTLGVPALTDAEMESFLQKAIEQVKPYYDKKKAEIEAGIKEGRVRSMEDLLVEMREVRADIEGELARFDIEQAETEEDLVRTLADITSTKEENLEAKTADWRDRIRAAKTGQVQTGVLTSGIGQQRIRELLEREETEKEAITRRAGVATAEEEAGAKYDIERITLARESAQRERVRRLGTPEEEQQTEAGALGELGYTGMGELPSAAEIERARAERNITTYRPEALTDITEEEKKAIESRKLTLQQETLAQREAAESAERKKIEADIAKKKREAAMYGYAL